jgi:opacity protein-like surface antigen
MLASLVALLLIAAPSAWAQDAGEFSAGWRLLHVEEETAGAGWYADAAWNLSNVVGIVGEVGGSYKSTEESEVVGGVRITASGDANVHTVMGGLRVSARQNPRIVPFGQFLLGLVHASLSIEGSATVGGRTITVDESDSDSEFGMQLGGGVNIGVTDSLGLRAGASWGRVFEEDASNVLFVGAGVVLGF